MGEKVCLAPSRNSARDDLIISGPLLIYVINRCTAAQIFFTRAQLPFGMPCGVTVLRHTLAHTLQTWDSRGFEWDSQTEGEIRAQRGGGVGEGVLR